MAHSSTQPADERREFEHWVAPLPRTVVLQPTSLCNLGCRYCYLPDRLRRLDMPIEVAAAVADGLATDRHTPGHVEILWHGGEPLTVGPRRFLELLNPFQDLARSGRVHHCLQTNATLISDEWCELFSRHEISIGVSIDGPALLNSERVDRAGRPAFERITAGIATLRAHGIGFSAIAVVGARGIESPGQLLDFLASLGAQSIGLNIEEREGVNDARDSPGPEQARRFWRAVLAWSGSNPHVALRDLRRLGHYVSMQRNAGADRHAGFGATLLDPIPTISWNGDVVLLSPELAGIKDPAYDDFLAGNVLERPLMDILGQAHSLGYVQEFLRGLTACQATCQFFDFCQGAQAGNRYFENHSFASTETNYCRVSRQELVKALIDITQSEKR